MLSSRITSAPASSACVDLRRRLALDLHAQQMRGVAARAGNRRGDAAGRLDVVVLDQDAVVQAQSGGCARRPGAQRTSPARAGRAWSCACPRCGVCARTAAAQRAASVAMPERRPRKLSAVRSPVSIARASPSMRASAAPAHIASSSTAPRSVPRGRATERRARDRQAGDDAVLTRDDRAGHGFPPEGRQGGHVAPADVLRVPAQSGRRPCARQRARCRVTQSWSPPPAAAAAPTGWESPRPAPPPGCGVRPARD